MGLLSIFRNKKQHKKEKTHQPFNWSTIFYHEDDFRQVEIIPDDNLRALKAESEKIFASTKDLNSSGYTDIYVRNDENKTKLFQRKIAPKDLEKIFDSLGFDRIPYVLTGYGKNYREHHKDCVAFGKDYCAVFYDFNDNFVEHIWFINHWSMDRERLSKSLYDLGQQWSLILQDWNLNVTVDLKDRNSIDHYLATFDVR